MQCPVTVPVKISLREAQDVHAQLDRRDRADGCRSHVLSADTARPGIDWPSFRGPGASGVAEGAPAPTTWDVPGNKNVKWRVPVPGLAHSSPVVWGNQVCTASAVSGQPDPQLKVGLYGDIASVDRRDGTPLARDLLRQADRQAALGAHRARRRAEGEAAHEVDARQLHARDRRPLHPRVLRIGGAVRLRHEGQAGLEEGLRPAGLRLLHGARTRSGDLPARRSSTATASSSRSTCRRARSSRRSISRRARSCGERRATTCRRGARRPCTSNGARAQVIVNGWKHIGGYDLATGKELWRMTGGGDIPVPTPIAAHGLIFITNAHGGNVADLRDQADGGRRHHAQGRGDGQRAHRMELRCATAGTCKRRSSTATCCTSVDDNGCSSVFDAKTGQRHYQSRLADGRTGFSASPSRRTGASTSRARKATCT